MLLLMSKRNNYIGDYLMKVKDYIPKYAVIEPLHSFDTDEFESGMTKMSYMTWNKFKKEFGDYYIYSVCNYHDTHTTSIIFGKSDLGPDEKVQFLENDGTGVKEIK